jgi:small subunit ribosomal protein S6
MAFYECTILSRQELSTAQVTALTDEIGEIAIKNGGKVAKSEYWGLRSLAYRMNKAKKAHYNYLELDIPSKGMIELSRLMGLNENILRTLTVAIDALPEGPSAMMLAKQREESRMDPEFSDVFVDGGHNHKDRGERSGGDEGFRRSRSMQTADVE